VDLGRTFRVNPLPGEVSRNSLASWGGGFRLSQEKAFSLRFDLAQILDQGGTRQPGRLRVLAERYKST
jgi:hemolysin activation/secretion protein